jgi:crotonobetainyl-CoA:carnitine CoA-transferase CaiB-like acyl-CoA transferase
MSITGTPDGLPGAGPQKVGVALADILTACTPPSGYSLHSHHRNATGQGQWLDIALLDVQIASLANQASNFLVGGMVPQRMATRTRTSFRTRTFLRAMATW